MLRWRCGRGSVTDKLALKYGVIASYGSTQYMEPYFGVTSDQPLASGLERYKANAGFKTAGVQLNSIYFLPNS